MLQQEEEVKNHDKNIPEFGNFKVRRRSMPAGSLLEVPIN